MDKNDYYIFPQLRFTTAVDKDKTISSKEADQKQQHVKPGSSSMYKRLVSKIGTYLTPHVFNAGNVVDMPPPKVEDIRKIVIIGIHGWFPARWLQLVVGEPTGTSPKFCSMMDSAVKAFFRQNFDIDLESESVTQIPLVSHGMILKRVGALWEQLVQYADVIRSADCIIVATHSQGTPVSVLLLEKLLNEGLIRPRPRCRALRQKHPAAKYQRIGLLAMAGISHGPILAIKSNMIVKYFEQDAARELFEFCSSEQPITTEYRHALHVILERGVRMLAVASWYDQVVPLYSAILEKVRHPNLWRSLYISSNDYKGPNDFLMNLIHVVLHLLNVGISDKNVILCLSDFAAGSMYSGTPGHSIIYEEPMVYEQLLTWLFWDSYAAPDVLESTKYVYASDSCSEEQYSCSNSTLLESWNFTSKPLNPYVLPMRLVELLMSSEIEKAPSALSNALKQVIKEFPNWRPEDKLGQELVYRLEGLVQSRL